MTPALTVLALLAAAEPGPLEGCRAQLLWPPSKKVWAYHCDGWEMRVQDVFRIQHAKMRDAVEEVMDVYTDGLEPSQVRSPSREYGFSDFEIDGKLSPEAVRFRAEEAPRPRGQDTRPATMSRVEALAVGLDLEEGTRLLGCMQWGSSDRCRRGLAAIGVGPWRAPLAGVPVDPPADIDPLPPPLRACRAVPADGGWDYQCPDGYVVKIVDDPRKTAKQALAEADELFDLMASRVKQPPGMPPPRKRIDHVILQVGTVETLTLEIRTWDHVPVWKRFHRKEYALSSYAVTLERPEGTRLLLCTVRTAQVATGICRTSFDVLASAPWRGPAVTGSVVEPVPGTAR